LLGKFRQRNVLFFIRGLIYIKDLSSCWPFRLAMGISSSDEPGDDDDDEEDSS
jgi:hypothetical protein